MLAQLQCADVSRDSPAVFDRDTRRVARHRALPLGDDFEEMPHRRLAQAVHVIRGRGGEAALDDHSAPAARLGVARRAETIEAFPGPLEALGGYRERGLQCD